jgi:exodeoxyribonuclease-3
LLVGITATFRHQHPERVGYAWRNQVTRARERNVGWRLAYFFVLPDLKDKIVEAKVYPDVMGSKNCPVSLTLAL